MKEYDPPREPARYDAPLTVQEALELLEKGKRLYDALGPRVREMQRPAKP